MNEEENNSDPANLGAMELDPALAAQLEKVAADEEQHAYSIGEADLPSADAASAELPEDATSVQPFAEDFIADAAQEAADFPDPNENSNPAIAVDDMLSAGVLEVPDPLPEDLDSLSSRSVDALSQPTFHATIPLSLPKEKTEKLMKHAAALGFPDSVWNNAHPIFSQLTEYQALSFRKLAAESGIEIPISIVFPTPTISEEEEALGDLAAVPDADLPLTEGAASIVLAKNEKEVMILVDPLLGVSIRESFGLVTAHRSIPRKLFREDEAHLKLKRELRRVASRSESEMPDSQLAIQIRSLLRELQKLALQRGGNALIGFQFQTFSETNHLDPALDQLRLVAFGTAAVVEKV
jgi:uncharacterized protein YbjQ (UPF0145 family)